eukprot:TRINITY_DN87632_c0_g1_i1.p1 TRINITY_DN87632_c0_g1~~TRINITY_DN87632_c0_g1_i1.p1  ORF type:complete len:234 (-),score=30.05 TRINITY_DN87632_c0_g1_i1:566-1267(-)
MAAPTRRLGRLSWRSHFAAAQLVGWQRHFSSEGSKVELLWAPGAAQARNVDDDRFAGKIGLQCRNYEGHCVIGARGEAATANAIRGIAKASELGKSPVEFRARWHEEPNDERSLRFFADISDTWTVFKKRWAALEKKPQLLQVTPNTSVHNLATAVVTEQRKLGGSAMKLNPKNDTVLAIAAKTLATLPHLAQHEDIGGNLVCVLRWPRIQSDTPTFVYAHIFWKKDENPDSH